MKYLNYLLILITVTACQSDDDDDIINCTSVFVSGLEVQVKDASTDAIISKGITVTAEDGAYSELLVFEFDRFIGAGERQGNYTITVTGEDYMTEVVGPIEVLADECHVITENVEVELTLN